MKRPIAIILIGYIFGIIWGYTFKISILLFWLFFLCFLYLFKDYKLPILKILKKVFNKKIILVLVISSIISNLIVFFYNNKYDNLYKYVENTEIIGTIISEKYETNYKERYIIKVISINGDLKYKNTNLFVYLKKGTQLNYADVIKIKGKYTKPSGSRNDKGYSQENYFKTKKIYGIIYAEELLEIKKEYNKDIFYFANMVKEKIKENVNAIFEEENAKLLLGITLGQTDQISDLYIDYFRDSNLYHLLAVSGTHVGYVIIRNNTYINTY